MNKILRKEGLYFFTIIVMVLIGVSSLHGQKRRRDLGPSTLGIDKGVMEYNISCLNLKLLKSSQTVASLKEVSDSILDYTPGDRLEQRDKNGFYHLGDINLGIRNTQDSAWQYYSTAKNRKDITPVENSNSNILAVADLSNTLPDSIPVKIIRYWERDGDNLVLRFELSNITDNPFEIGALGIPMVFNNNYNNKSLDEAHTENTFFDPYIGNDAGYLQIVKLNGRGKVLIVVPYGKTPFEAYRPLNDDPTPIGHTFEGLHEWMVHSKSYAQTEWAGVKQWNEPTSVMLAPGESINYGLEFLVADSLREIENTLIKNNRPVAVGVPGYVVPTDVNARLFLNYSSKVTSWEVEPAGAIDLVQNKETKNGWRSYDVKGILWGRARLTIHYEDGLNQTINYKIIEPEQTVVESYGNFLMTKQWFDDTTDIFQRAPSVITYDYEKQQKVTQDARAWIPGLSDEGGAGSWLGAVMKQMVLPDIEEIKKLEDFVNQTMWSGIQYDEGDHKYGVRKSLFYYEPDSMPPGTYSDEIRWGRYSGFPSWDRREAESVGRSYNYPHVAAAYWTMYRLARYHNGYVSRKDWSWYLENAYQTTMAMVEQAPHYAQFGQMEGTVFILILNDLKAEGYAEMAKIMEAAMKLRVEHWASLAYPFGSEMPWDSTGQEEVYMWSRYFGFDEKALVTLNAILAYMPTIPHWAYNGNARRFWDFLYGGKLTRFERMIHHYGSALNSIPVLSEYRKNPSDFYLLRVGYGGLMGSIANITKDGFAPCAFHSFPQTLKNDGISGDYGTGFFGYAVNTSSYLIHHNEFGWLTFGGNYSQIGDWVRMDITTAAKNRVFIAPESVWLTLDAGHFKSVSYNSKLGEIKLEFENATEFTPEAFLHIAVLADVLTSGLYKTQNLEKDNQGALIVPLKTNNTEIVLSKHTLN